MQLRILLLALTIASIIHPCLAQETVLTRLYNERRFFDLRRELDSRSYVGDPDRAFFAGALSKMLNRPAEAITRLDGFIRKAAHDDPHLRGAFELKAQSLRSLSRYREAAAVYRLILERFKKEISAGVKADYENTLLICDTLRDIPPQTAFVPAASTIRGTGAVAKWDLLIEANGALLEMGVDTGANYSLIPVSTANKLGVKIFDQKIDLGTVNSAIAKVRLGVLPEMKIGNALIRNAVFLIMDDRELTFPDGFFLTGVIGFPVLSALNEITLREDGAVFIPKQPTSTGRSNLCLNGSDMLFQAIYNGNLLTFRLDTGAAHSDLYLSFFERFEKEVKASAETRTETITGAGGSEKLSAYILKTLRLTVVGRTIDVPQVRLFTKVFGAKDRGLYGNIGRDAIEKLKQITINFQSMRITAK